MTLLFELSRRRVLRGVMGGAAVTVGLPFLDCFLDSNGTALASGAPLPVCFGTWFWGCGLNPGRWEPKTAGKITQLGPELQALAPYQRKLNVYSGMNAFLDGKSTQVHLSGTQAILAGTVPRGLTPSVPSIDTLVADVIGSKTRFRSLEVACCGKAVHSHSRRQGSVVNPAEISPAALYTRIFGPEFTDPNAATFVPDPAIMIRRSALSSVSEERQAVLAKLGAADRARLDEYFTSLRALEQQLDLALQKPAPLEACTVPGKTDGTPIGNEVAMAAGNHKLFTGLLTHALACGQTQIINVAYNEGTSGLRKTGNSQSHHECTHEEPVDQELGYQPDVTFFLAQIIASLGEMIGTLDSIKEGDRTLLDRMLLMTATDHGYAKIHGLDNIPIMTAGGANGRMKTGIHVIAAGDPVSRVGLTIQQALGLPVSSWGTESNETSKTITEVVA
jgi:hypothetical protein